MINSSIIWTMMIQIYWARCSQKIKIKVELYNQMKYKYNYKISMINDINISNSLRIEIINYLQVIAKIEYMVMKKRKNLRSNLIITNTQIIKSNYLTMQIVCIWNRLHHISQVLQWSQILRMKICLNLTNCSLSMFQPDLSFFLQINNFSTFT